MTNIYFPNIFRTGNYLSSNKLNPYIPYSQQFDIDNEDQLKLFLYVRTNKLIELILIYDRVYVDMIDLPILLDKMLSMDVDATNEIIDNSYLSFVNTDDYRISCSEYKLNGVLAYGKTNTKYIYHQEDFEKILYSYNDTLNKIKPVIGKLYDNRINYNRDYAKKVLNSTIDDLKLPKLKETLRIKTKDPRFIIKSEIPIINALCEANKGLHLAEKLRLDNVYLDDVIRFVIKSKMENLNSVVNILDLNKMLRMYEVPDITLLLLQGELTLKNILEIKKSKEFKAFQKWLLSNSQHDNNIIKNYTDSIKRVSKGTSIPMKALRLATTSTIGALNPILGIGASAVDTFLLDKIKREKDISDSLEKVVEKIGYTKADSVNFPNVLTEEFNITYLIKE